MQLISAKTQKQVQSKRDLACTGYSIFWCDIMMLAMKKKLVTID